MASLAVLEGESGHTRNRSEVARLARGPSVLVQIVGTQGIFSIDVGKGRDHPVCFGEPRDVPVPWHSCALNFFPILEHACSDDSHQLRIGQGSFRGPRQVPIRLETGLRSIRWLA